MRVIWILVLVAMVSGCAQPAGSGRYQRPGPSEAYVDLRPYVFNGRYTAYESPKETLKKTSISGEIRLSHELNG